MERDHGDRIDGIKYVGYLPGSIMDAATCVDCSRKMMHLQTRILKYSILNSSS